MARILANRNAISRARRPAWFVTTVISIALLSSTPAAVAAAGSDLDRWLDNELAPWLGQQLATHPRFRGQPVQIVAALDRDPDPRPNALTAVIRDRVVQHLTARRGVVLAREPAPPDWQRPGGPPRLDCRPGDERYRIAVEAAEDGATGASVRIRILDLDDGVWVAGFARDWRGRLDRGALADLRHHAPVERLRGQRALPFTPQQPDLLAAQLAFVVGCGILAQPEVDLTAWIDPDSAGEDGAETLRLVGNYLARADVLRLAESRDEASLLLTGEIHLVDGPLRQLWVSLRPDRPSPGLPSIEASAYLSSRSTMGAERVAGVPADQANGSPQTPTGMTFDLLQLPSPCRPGRCDRVGIQLDPEIPLPDSDSLALEITSQAEVRAFLLSLTPESGLLRLAPADCNGGAGVRIGKGKRLRHPVPAGQAEQGDWTLFAVTVQDKVATRTLISHLSSVPAGCGTVSLRGAPLESWLDDLQGLMTTMDRDAAWRGLRLRFDRTGGPGLMARQR